MYPRYPNITVMIGRLQNIDDIKMIVSNALVINKINKREILQFNHKCESITDLETLIDYVMMWVYIK